VEIAGGPAGLVTGFGHQPGKAYAHECHGERIVDYAAAQVSGELGAGAFTGKGEGFVHQLARREPRLDGVETRLDTLALALHIPLQFGRTGVHSIAGHQSLSLTMAASFESEDTVRFMLKLVWRMRRIPLEISIQAMMPTTTAMISAERLFATSGSMSMDENQ